MFLVPGDGGSQIEVKLNKTSTLHYLCTKTTSGFETLWLVLEITLVYIRDCWIDNIKLNYDNNTRTTSNQQGVETRVPGWGTTDVIEWLDPSLKYIGSYFSDIANALVNLGYERNKSLRGAPYEFRIGPRKVF